MHETTHETKKNDFLADGQQERQPVFFRDHFINVAAACSHTSVFPNFADNADLAINIPNWPDPDPELFCLFSVPTNQQPSDNGRAHEKVKRHLAIDHFVNRLIKDLFIGEKVLQTLSSPQVELPELSLLSNHTGMGRGIGALPFPLAGSSEALALASQERIIKPGQLGFRDKKTGFFYTTLGMKGNGPTADQMMAVLEGGEVANYRLHKKDAWGILWDAAVREIEQPVLEKLASIGFRVGRVIFQFDLDRRKLITAVKPHFQRSKYFIEYELVKGLSSWQPCIIGRLGGGVRLDVMAEETANIELLREGVHCLASEMLVDDQAQPDAGKQAFIERYKIPASLFPFIDTLAAYDPEQELGLDILHAYFVILSFLTWRNYRMQDEYNAKYSLPIEELRKIAQDLNVTIKDESDLEGKLGPLMLNYKPGDLDISGYFFDVDVFIFKRNVAIEVGYTKIRESDAEAVREGLGYIGEKILKLFPGYHYGVVVENTKDKTARISQNEGFLPKDQTRIELYSDISDSLL